MVAATWLKSVLPLVGDAESSIQERCLDTFQENVIDSLMAFAHKPCGVTSREQDCSRCRILLTALGMQGSPARTALGRLTGALSKRGVLKPQLLRALENLLDGRACEHIMHRQPCFRKGQIVLLQTVTCDSSRNMKSSNDEIKITLQDV